MGHTNYWDQKREAIDLPTWREACNKIREMIKDTKAPIWGEEATDPPQIDDDMIYFNGGCETFYVVRDPGPDTMNRDHDKGWKFDFCKTRQMPYDSTVVDALVILKTVCPDNFNVSSDGDDLQEALDGYSVGESMGKAAVAWDKKKHHE